MEIEAAAQTLMDDITHARAALPERIRQEAKLRGAEIEKETDASVRAFASTKKRETEQRIQEIEQAARRAEEAMETAFALNRESWRNDLVSVCLSMD
jgi:hypothetical protein